MDSQWAVGGARHFARRLAKKMGARPLELGLRLFHWLTQSLNHSITRGTSPRPRPRMSMSRM